MEKTRLLIVTEEPFRDNSFGFGRTITNLFSAFEIEQTIVYVKDGEYTHPDYRFDTNTLYFNASLFRCNKPKWYAPILNRLYFPINHSYLYLRSNKDNINLLKKFDPDIVLIVPMDYTTLLEGYLTARRLKKPFIVYLMDDSLRIQGFHIGGSTNYFHQKIMSEASGWMMISEYLTKAMVKKFPKHPPYNLVVHNPIEEKFIQTISQKSANKNLFRVSYAGSIHTFHADALINFARAVQQLRRKGVAIELTVYCQDFAWSTYKSALNIEGVVYAGILSYDQLFSELNKSDLLLCTTSFDQVHRHLVETSVFTKITDYMAAAVPVLSYGPEYAANSKYLEKNNVGFFFNKSDINSLAEYIEYLIEKVNIERGSIVERQLDLIRRKHTFSEVREQILDFFKDIKKVL